jgi:hypothetical protein
MSHPSDALRACTRRENSIAAAEQRFLGFDPGRDLHRGCGLNSLMISQVPSSSELIELSAGLHRLARNLWWTWNQDAQDLFLELSPRSWQNLYHNAVAVLCVVSESELLVHLMEPDFGAGV